MGGVGEVRGKGLSSCVLFRSVGPPGFPSFEGVLFIPNSGLSSGQGVGQERMIWAMILDEK